MRKIIVRFLSVVLSLTFIFSSFSVFSFGATLAKGDLDGDGELTTADAIAVLRGAAGILKLTSSQKTAADFDEDGTVSSWDAREVLCEALGIVINGDYLQKYLDDGFPLSYAEKLVALHDLHPNWEFIAFDTDLDWSTAVSGEHTPHKKQLIENSVPYYFMCDCSKCNGVIQESSCWVSASQYAVEYYLDPRNFLTEDYIFQFEDTAYSATQTQAGVEAIISGTWMANSTITYLDASGNTKTYTENGQKVKYSQVILNAAKQSGMSAYYLASKIVQEVGSSTSSYAGGSCGTFTGYKGIYNYYNIGAYTGAADGLKWASFNTLTASSATQLYETASTSGTKLATVPLSTKLTYLGESGNFYKVKVTLSGTDYTGYVAKSVISASYGRPWDNPAKSIYNGAKYIYAGYSQYQYTGYLQKFNVNKSSGNLYNHEYMGNIRAAAAEGKKTFRAYTSAGVLESQKIFSIPVFENMPNADVNAIGGFKNTATVMNLKKASTAGIVLRWIDLDMAEGYYVYKYNNETGKYTCIKTTTDNTYTDTSFTLNQEEKYYVVAYSKDNGTTVRSKQSEVITAKVSSSAETPTETLTGTVKVSDVLNVRSAPDTTADNVITRLPNGTTVTLLGQYSTWYKITVTVSGKTYTGYVAKEYITTTAKVPDITNPLKETCPYDEPTTTLRNGSGGEGVKWLQWYLFKLGYLTKESDIDGDFGSGTESAVKKFQTDAKIEVDGIVGSGTRSSLKTAYNK